MKKRRNYFIKKKFQASFFVKFALLLLLEAVLIAALFMHVSKGTLTAVYRGTELTIQQTNAYFFVSFFLITLIVGVSIGIAAIFVFMHLSHRLGGPLYRFEKTIEDATKGNLAQRVRLRKSDQLFELRDRINGFLEEIDSCISHIKENIQKGLQVISQDKNKDSLNKIEKILEHIKSSLEHFKTSK